MEMELSTPGSHVTAGTALINVASATLVSAVKKEETKSFLWQTLKINGQTTSEVFQ